MTHLASDSGPKSKLEKFAELAAKTGRVAVSPDVYEEIKKLRAASPESSLYSIEVKVCEFLAPGTALAWANMEILDVTAKDVL